MIRSLKVRVVNNQAYLTHNVKIKTVFPKTIYTISTKFEFISRGRYKVYTRVESKKLTMKALKKERK
jgi:hypothetical protein